MLRTMISRRGDLNKLQNLQHQIHWLDSSVRSSVSVQEHEIIDESELMKDLEDDNESNSDFGVGDKENVRLVSDLVADQKPVQSFASTPLSEIDISSFWPPDLDSDTLFNPNLLKLKK
ncbi:hypothetical protein L6452_23164 [Arctium lappa]|uniref:Uncharacterized protein n=1 Tax=Arctium lappa TaxID=4217 RepID=A0ACB9B3A5_ARCLA|nr:hypothetical protein L6452_23164 [Arctium lappa]